jgi:hypothetical protein
MHGGAGGFGGLGLGGVQQSATISWAAEGESERKDRRQRTGSAVLDGSSSSICIQQSMPGRWQVCFIAARA